jgi:hypothetical protein
MFRYASTSRRSLAAFPVRASGLFAALTGLVLLAGCASDDVDPRSCPHVAILEDAATVTQFDAAEAVDLTDIVVRAALSNIRGGCEYYEDEVDVSFDVTLSAERGPALEGTQVSLDYFVTILNPEGEVMVKRVFTTPVTFPDGIFRAGALESLEQSIPINDGDDARGYTILLGFQLTQDQVNYNRRSRNKG